MKRKSYSESYDLISRYANEMLPYFADGWSRFPQGGNAAMIVNFLNTQADFWRDHNPELCQDLLDVATEIITRN
ncbi:MAG: hypothetical protein BBJ57_02305 [Desulfobacterales bacterium PC51MH44]|nr:MAG: hypothetical protein BBJ57_02305 [Desulfobacterales bacterium PC51MH44]